MKYIFLQNQFSEEKKMFTIDLKYRIYPETDRLRLSINIVLKAA